jgi:hypothetical protein
MRLSVARDELARERRRERASDANGRGLQAPLRLVGNVPATAMIAANCGFGSRNVVRPSPVSFPSSEKRCGFSAAVNVCPCVKSHPLGAAVPSKRRNSPIIGAASTLAGIGSAASGTTRAVVVFGFPADEGATPGSARMTW